MAPLPQFGGQIYRDRACRGAAVEFHAITPGDDEHRGNERYGLIEGQGHGNWRLVQHLTVDGHGADKGGMRIGRAADQQHGQHDGGVNEEPAPKKSSDVDARARSGGDQ